MSIYLECFSVIGFCAIKMEPWLSPLTGIGARLYLSSVTSDQIQKSCFEASDIAIYSASVDDVAIVFCCREDQTMGADVSWKKYLVVDLCLDLGFLSIA